MSILPKSLWPLTLLAFNSFLGGEPPSPPPADFLHRALVSPSPGPNCSLPPLPSGLEDDPALIIRQPAILNQPVFGSFPNASDAEFSFSRLVLPRNPRPEHRSSLQRWFEALTRVHSGVQRPLLSRQWDLSHRAPESFPLRLLAIVNRQDLFQTAPGTCGELRFVYGAYGLNSDGSEALLDLYVILEFTVSCPAWSDVKTWSQNWLQLRNPTGLPDRLTALLRQSLAASKPPRIRVNQANGSLDPWRFSQFSADGLAPQNLDQNPASGTLCSPQLSEMAIHLTESRVPEQALDHAAFNPPATFFDYASSSIFLSHIFGHPSDARFAFAVRTCVGCHSTETRHRFTWESFVHIHNRGADEPSRLSSFLTGGTMHLTVPSDDACPGSSWQSEPCRVFHDLLRRRQILEQTAAVSSETGLVSLPRLRQVH